MLLVGYLVRATTAFDFHLFLSLMVEALGLSIHIFWVNIAHEILVEIYVVLLLWYIHRSHATSELMIKHTLLVIIENICIFVLFIQINDILLRLAAFNQVC